MFHNCGHYHPNITLDKHAFLAMVTSCIEVYKKEAMGIIMGEQHKKHYLIRDAIGYQSAERGYWGVTVSGTRIKRMNYALRHMTKSQMLGFFHSHPESPEHLSGLDKKEHIQEQVPLQILIVVKKTTKHRPWHRHKDYSIAGTIGNKYFIKVIAYEYDQKRKKICPIKIVCPSIHLQIKK